MIRAAFFFLVFSGLAIASVSDARIIGVTNTQAVLAFTAPDAAACTVEVSESASFQPLAHDVDPKLFPGADRDDRAGNVTDAQQRIFVIGARRTDRSPSGARFSRALQANTAHYYRITCGADSATGSFRTSNIPLGSTHMDALETDNSKPGVYLQPSANVLFQPVIIDPKTGVQLQTVNTLGWAYAGATREAGASFAAAEDASGKWSEPSSALSANGSYASYSSNTQDWLWLRFPPYPGSSSFTANSLSFQNILLKGYCDGPDCASGGQTVEICITRFGIDEDGPHCEAPIREADFPPSDGTITLCGDGAPCQQPAKPGDLLTFDTIPTSETKPGRGYIYNDKSDYTLLRFTMASDCARLRPGDVLQVFRSPSVSMATITLQSLDCGAEKPQAIAKNAVALDVNGEKGIPFYYQAGANSNPRYGILIRKKSTTARSTIYLDWAGWRAASAVTATFAFGSGGFNRVCTKQADANGFYHCYAGSGLITGIRTEEDGNLTVRYLGTAWILGQTVRGLRSGFQLYGNSLNDFLWDDIDPNVFYFSAPASYTGGGLVVVKATYTGNDIECGQPGAACAAANPYGNEFTKLSQLPAKFDVLNPCLRDCNTPEDDISVETQLARYTSGTDVPYLRSGFGRCSLEAVQGKTLVVACRQAEQDSYSWILALDLGNGLPMGAGYEGRFGNSQQVFAANPIFARPISRWCTLHTYQNIRAEGIATPEFQNEKTYPFRVTQVGSLAACGKSGGGNCGPCPSVIVNGVDYSGKNVCDTFNSSSAWNDAWGAAPDRWQPGEPVSALANLHWLQTFEVGDVLQNGGEQIRILQKNGPSQYVVERGVGSDQSYQYPRAHSDQAVWSTACQPAGAHWFYVMDRYATGAGATYFPTTFVNHALGRDGVRLHPDYSVSRAPFTPADMQSSSYLATIGLPRLFAGRLSNAAGNAIEKHPSYNQEAAEPEDQKWFVDGHPYLFIGNSNRTLGAVPMGGDLYRYRYTGSIDPKHYDLAAFTGTYPLTDISGPKSVLTGEPSDAYKVCFAWRAGECTADSEAGNVYFNVPALDLTTPWCFEGEFYGGWRDICISNFNAIGASYAQWGLPESGGTNLANFRRGRVLTRLFEGYRGSATTNAKPTPDGKWLMFRSNRIAKIPPFPAADEYDRSNFIPMVLSVAPADTPIDNVIVEFGYDPVNFYCSSRREACISTTVPSDGFDAKQPYWYATSDRAENGGPWSGAGVPCSAGCSVALPGLSERVLYYRVTYRDSANQAVVAGPIQVTTVP